MAETQDDTQRMPWPEWYFSERRLYKGSALAEIAERGLVGSGVRSKPSMTQWSIEGNEDNR